MIIQYKTNLHSNVSILKSVLYFSSDGWPWTYFLHLSPSSVILIDSFTGSPVHVLMLSIQVVRGLPRLRAPGIVPCIIFFFRRGNSLCFLMVWPWHASFLALTVSNSSLALLRTHSFVSYAVHETRRIFLSLFISKASRRVPSFFLSVQLSQPYVATGHTGAYISRIFIEMGKLWLSHIFCSEGPIAVPLFNLVQNSVVHSPSSVIRDPRYGNISTCSSCSFWMSMQHARPSLAIGFVDVDWVGCIYCWLGLGDPPAPVVLPLKWPTGWCHQHSEGLWLLTVQSKSIQGLITVSTRILIKYWERTQPCLSPFLTRNHSDSVPSTLPLASCFLYSLASKSIECRGYSMLIIVTQSLSWEIESNAFLKSTQHIQSRRWCSCALCISILRFYLSCLRFVQLHSNFRQSLTGYIADVAGTSRAIDLTIWKSCLEFPFEFAASNSTHMPPSYCCLSNLSFLCTSAFSSWYQLLSLPFASLFSLIAAKV